MTMFEYTPSGTSRMTRRKLFDGVAMSSLALSSVGTVVASVSWRSARIAWEISYSSRRDNRTK